MTTATTRQAIRQELYNRIPGLAFVGEATGVTGTTLTDAIRLQDTSLGSNHYRGYYLYRPNVDAANQVRKVISHVNSTGVVTHGGATYDDALTDVDYEMVGLIHPEEINNAITRALGRVYFENQIVLPGRITDGDMDSSATTSWTDVGTPNTKSKVTSAGNVATGIRALRVLNDAAGEGVRSVTVRGFAQSTTVDVHAGVRCDVGTAVLQLYDVTNSAIIASVSSTEEAFVHLWLRYQLPVTCEEWCVRLIGTEDTADLYWDHVAAYCREDRVFPVATTLDSPWKLQKLREMRYTHAVSSQSNGGYDGMFSREYHDWYTPSGFVLEPFHLETNPYSIVLNRQCPCNELWIQMKRPWTDGETLSTDAATTLVPLEPLYAYATEEIAKVLRKRYPADNRWEVLLSEATTSIEAETMGRTDTPLAPKRTDYYGVI